jgi:ubiquinone/menaquinone biosynthesis C-methylase UbiE
MNIKWITVFEALKIYNDYLKKNMCWHFKTKYLEKFKIFKNKYIIETFLNYLSSNDNTWSNLYKDYIKKEYSNWDQYYNTKMKLKRKFLKQVIKYSKSGKPILECGCGTGKGSLYFALLGIDTYAMDLEQSMVDDTNNLSSIRCPLNPIKAFKGNVNSIPYKDKFFSVTHSSGVMEHYSDIDIVKMINEQIRVSDYCVFSVPTKYFEKKMLGNERFMTRREWTNIINKSNACVIKKTGYHYKKLNKRIIDIIKKPKRLFKPIALYTFVLKEKGK